jgi:hypothetical protein
MIYASPYDHHERSVIADLRLLGLDGDRAIFPRHEFREELREQLVAEASLTNVA